MQETPIQENQGTEVKETKKEKSVKQEVLSWIRELAFAVVVVLIIKTFFFEIITVDGSSMLETLQDGDRLYVSLLTPRFEDYERGDIVICFYPGRTDRCVKRIVGLPGDTVSISYGEVTVNGKVIEEDYLTHLAGYHYPEITRAEDEYCVLGDNRPISMDSRLKEIGTVPQSRIMGKVLFALG